MRNAIRKTNTDECSVHYSIFIFIGCLDNSHINNLAKATTVNVIGWTFNNITNGHFNIGSEHENYKKCGEGEAWFGYGYSTRDLVGSIRS